MATAGPVGASATLGAGGIAPLLVGLAIVAALAVAFAKLLRAAASAGEARSRDDVAARLRALDELATVARLPPDEYAARRDALLREA